MYKIEKDVPVPLEGNRIYPLPEMEVGDSFLVTNRTREQIRSSIKGYRKYDAPAKRFRIRKVDNGIRVWRIK